MERASASLRASLAANANAAFSPIAFACPTPLILDNSPTDARLSASSDPKWLSKKSARSRTGRPLVPVRKRMARSSAVFSAFAPWFSSRSLGLSAGGSSRIEIAVIVRHHIRLNFTLQLRRHVGRQRDLVPLVTDIQHAPDPVQLRHQRRQVVGNHQLHPQ